MTRSWPARAGSAIALVGVAVLAAIAVRAPAAGAATGLALSRDGQHWTPALADPLFAPSLRWVPGDSRVSTFYVRNDTGQTAQLHVSTQAHDASGLLASGELMVEARVGQSPWAAVPAGQGALSLPGQSLPAGQAQPVSLRVEFRWSAPNATQRDSVQLTVSVTLSAPHAPRPPDGPLGWTGAPILTWTLLGVLLLIGGVATVVVARGERRDVH